MTHYQIGFETNATRNTGIPDRFATLSRAALDRQFPAYAVELILSNKSWTSTNGSVFYLASTFVS